MKELSIEQKAKAYDKAIQKAKEWYSDAQMGIGFKANLENLFPELKDSGNEKKQEDSDFIEIPFGAFDSELYHQEIYIPDGFEATIKDNRVILKRKENEDERIRKELCKAIWTYVPTEEGQEYIAWLEKQGEQKFAAKNIVEIWKDMRFEVYAQADGNRHEPNYSDDSTKMFSLNDIDEIFEKITESYEAGYEWNAEKKELKKVEE